MAEGPGKRSVTRGELDLQRGPDVTGIVFVQQITHFAHYSEVILYNPRRSRRMAWHARRPAEIAVIRRLEQMIEDSDKADINPLDPRYRVLGDAQEVHLPPGMAICPRCNSTGLAPDGTTCATCDGAGLVTRQTALEHSDAARSEDH